MNPKQQEYYDSIVAAVEAKGGKVISERYVKMIDKMIFRCENGHEWDTEARSVLKGMWCRYCHGNTREQGEERFLQRVADKGGVVVGKYVGNHNHVLVQCSQGHQWDILPYNLTVGKWCPVCGYKDHGGGSKRFLEILEERKGKLLGRYTNGQTPVSVQCENGHTWDPKPYYVVIGNWCPLCTGSTGEQSIASYLREKGIAYKTQCTIPGLPRRRYDFILEYNGRNFVVEFDGEMHFKFMPYYHGTEKFFLYRQAIDRVKTLHALNNSYQVIRIDYSQLLKIREHLDVFLKKEDRLCVSTPHLYQGWLGGASVPPEEVVAVNEAHSRRYFEEREVDDLTDNMLQFKLQ